MPATQAPYSQYFDKNGQPLDAGYVWFGLPNQNPKTSPVNVYWDADLTQPALQPIRTLAGYLARNGSPAQVFTDGAYSQIVENKRFEMVYYAANSADYSDLPIRVAVITATDGQTLVNLPFAYTRGNNSLAIYLNGILLIKDKDYTETSTTSVTMIRPLKVGPGGADEVTAIGGRLINAASAIDAVSAAALAAGSGAGLVGYDPSLTFPAGTVGERLQQTTYTVDAITAVNATALGLVDGDMIQARGRTTAGDGGGGTFRYVAASTQTVDNGLVFQPTAGSGRLFRDGWTVFGYNEDINIKFFGAISGTDATSAIQAAIDAASAQPASGTVFIPDEVFSVTQIVVKSFTTIKGPAAKNGWARIANFNKGSVIKSLAGSNISPVKIESPSTNWTIQDIVIDANKAAQTSPGVHCIEHRRESATGSPGGVIKGVKCVNPTGFGAYIQAAHPLEISECFFMSGVFLGRTFDTMVTGCSIDGTDSKHPALWLGDSEHIRFGDNFVFRGESASQTVSEAYTVDTGTNTISVADDSEFYDGMPVALVTAGTYPDLRTPVGGILRGADTYLVKKMGGNVLRLYYRLDAAYAEATARVNFLTTGVGTQYITSGITDIVHVTRGFHVYITDSRVAGSPGGGATFALSSYCGYTNIDHWALNYDNGASEYGVKLIGCQRCVVNGDLGDSQPGGGLTLVKAAVLIADDQSNPSASVSISEFNKIGATSQLQGTQGLWVEDASTASYRNQNQITAWTGESSSSTQRILSANLKRQAGVYYYSALTTTASIPNSSNTSLAWTAVTKGNPGGVTNASTISIPGSADSLLNVKGKVGFSNRQTGTYYVLVLVTVGGVGHRFLWEQQASASTPTYIVVPFDVSQVIGASDTSVTVQVFQNSGAALTVATTADYTQMTISKVADYVA